MPKGRLNTTEIRICEVCGEKFVPARVKQRACSASTGRRCAVILANRERSVRRPRDAEGALDDLAPRNCEQCGCEYVPRRVDQKKCGPDCPGVPYRDVECIECGKVVRATWRGNTIQVYCSESCREKAGKKRRGERFRRYKMTREEFEAKVEAQGGLCASCGELPAAHRKHEGLVVDHDHYTGELRDLLCSNCNTGLGLFGDDSRKLRLAADYLDRWQQRRADMDG